jgi:iron complex transport system permease protein
VLSGALAALALAVLAVVSLFVGELGPADLVRDLLAGGSERDAVWLLLVSRLPRTVAIILAGAASAIVGLIVQMIARNRYVEPSTIGTVESASLGMLLITIMAPAAPLLVKLGVAALAAIAGTALFLRILALVPLRDALVVPLIGLVLSGVLGAAAAFVALQYDLLQLLGSWTLGDFSGVIRGRYEMLWLVAVLGVLAYVAADRFAVVGMGAHVTTNLGLDHRAVVPLGLTIVALVTAVVVVVVGSVPFLGLVVPNIVSLLIGDNVRRGVPWVAILGAGLVLLADFGGRLVRFPYEIPAGTLMGVVGAALFLWLLVSRRGPPMSLSRRRAPPGGATGPSTPRCGTRVGGSSSSAG